MIRLLIFLLLLTSCFKSPVEDIRPGFDYLSVARQVDVYQSRNMGKASIELTKDRGGVTFAKVIADAVSDGLVLQEVPLGSLRSTFQVVGNLRVSLNEPLCEHTSELGVKLTREPISKSGLDLINSFSKEANKHEAYTRLMYCLAYSESLSTADGKSSVSMAKQTGAIKHDGVKHYFDARQLNPASQYNIGLYQFSPYSPGNIDSCRDAFGVSTRDRKELTSILGDKHQVFNARCGVLKILTLFYVSKNSANTNRQAGEKCVSLHNRNAYNHFGPLQRESGAGGGFTKLYNCYFGSQKL